MKGVAGVKGPGEHRKMAGIEVIGFYSCFLLLNLYRYFVFLFLHCSPAVHIQQAILEVASVCKPD